MRTPRAGQIARSAAVVCLVVGALGAVWWNNRPDPADKFCTTGLAFVVLDGEQIVLEDQGLSGRDGCDRVDRQRPGQAPLAGAFGGGVLGYDCKVRDSEGTVVASTEPNRSDGTCGQPDR